MKVGFTVYNVFRKQNLKDVSILLPLLLRFYQKLKRLMSKSILLIWNIKPHVQVEQRGARKGYSW